MKTIEPKIELTESEVNAINTVITLCKDLSNINGGFLDFVFEQDCADEVFNEVIDTLTIVLNICEH